MHIKQIRNATLLLEYAGTKFLIDPFLAEKDAYEGLPGTANSELRNPRVELKTPMDELLDVDAVIVTHMHSDHWDEAAVRLVPKHLPLYAQDDNDARAIQSQGFSDVRVLTPDSEFEGISLIKTDGQHGSDEALAAIGEVLGHVCGVVFEHSQEKTLYLAGDTVWNDHVRSALAKYEPDVVILNAGDAQVPGLGGIIMGTEDIRKVHEAAPEAILLASHMEAVNHAVLSRGELRDFAARNGLANSLLVPEDNEAYTF